MYTPGGTHGCAPHALSLLPPSLTSGATLMDGASTPRAFMAAFMASISDTADLATAAASTGVGVEKDCACVEGAGGQDESEEEGEAFSFCLRQSRGAHAPKGRSSTRSTAPQAQSL